MLLAGARKPRAVVIALTVFVKRTLSPLKTLDVLWGLALPSLSCTLHQPSFNGKRLRKAAQEILPFRPPYRSSIAVYFQKRLWYNSNSASKPLLSHTNNQLRKKRLFDVIPLVSLMPFHQTCSAKFKPYRNKKKIAVISHLAVALKRYCVTSLAFRNR